MRVLQTGRDFAPGKGPVVYIENHDHSSAVSRAGGRGRWWKTQAPLIALLTCPGAVMLHNGQELGDDYWLPDDGDGRVLPRPVRWELADDPAGEALLALHEKLIRIRREHPALRSANFHPAEYDQREVAFDPDGYGVHRDLGVAIYHRWGQGAEGRTERFIVAINFSDSDCIVDVPFSTNGEWHDLLNDESVEVQDWRWRGARIPSNWARVLWREE